MNIDLPEALKHAYWPVLIVNDLGTVLSHNPAALRCFGPVISGSKFSLKDLWSPSNSGGYRLLLMQLRADASEGLPAKFIREDGTVGAFHCVTSPVGGHFCVQLLSVRTDSDSGEAKPTPEDVSGLRQKQKLECALKLIETVALDFNNALTGILGHTSLILGRMQSGDPWYGSLREILKSVEKAAEIAFDLAAFSQQEKEANLQLAGDLNDIVRRTVEIYKSQGLPGIKWNLRLNSRLHSVKLEDTKMQQALMKVLDNAVQAMDSSGRVTIITSNLNLDKPMAEGNATIPEGRYIRIEFKDAGGGIDPQDMPRIFEPFFTTKPNHRGLGLAWVYGIVTNHAGRVTVVSSPGEGTSVRIYLPAAQKRLAEVPVADRDLRGNQTILMVDDEELLLTMGKTVLTSFGYTLMEAANGEDALRIYQQHADKIDLVVTDLFMPDMNGHELVQRIHQWRRDQKILCVSGYYQSGQTPLEVPFLQKPFTSQGLLQKVREVLTT